MSSKIVADIINRGVHDLAFREQLSTRPVQALAAYNLTDSEFANFQNLDKAAFAAWADELEEQEEQEGISFGLVILGGDQPDFMVHLLPRAKE
jgi:hypothetical protein